MRHVMKLYVIADRGVFASDDAWLRALVAIAPAVAASPDARLQVRIKGLSVEHRLALIGRVRAALGANAHHAILNGSVAEALANGFGGAHYPEATLPAELLVRPPGFTVGAAIHSTSALERSIRAGADYVLFGPVFDAGSKPVAGVGLEALRAVSTVSTVPVLAVGGITPGRVPACLAAGAVGVGVVSGILHAPNPAAAVRTYIKACTEAPPGAGDGRSRHLEPAFNRGEKS